MPGFIHFILLCDCTYSFGVNVTVYSVWDHELKLCETWSTEVSEEMNLKALETHYVIVSSQ